jgi:nitrite reductase/ring-hydroxylating ferredoxin subunit
VRSFFDPTLFETWGGAFIREDKVDDALRRLIPKCHISKGRFSYPGRSELRDLAWNHMDQNHRPFIHRTYDDAMRVHMGPSAAFSLTRFGNWPLVLPVFDGYFKENGFYQVICLFGLILVVCVIECNGEGTDTRMDIDWAIASHKMLRFLHGPLNKRLLRLNDVQNREDDCIRDRRVALRASGYRFGTDRPDFVSANVVANNVVFPPMCEVRSLQITLLPEGEAQTVDVAARSFILRRTGAGVDVWPGVCPHEGAALAPRHLEGRAVKCPWHGLEFPARRLVQNGSPITMCGARLQWVEGDVRISAAQAVATEA